MIKKYIDTILPKSVTDFNNHNMSEIVSLYQIFMLHTSHVEMQSQQIKDRTNNRLSSL